MEKFLCIHGHFYQPPRENAWLEEIEVQPSAHPYHDWNERVTEECYTSNTHSRILNDQERIIDIVNNYSRISFNFGPTLLSWMEEHTPTTYEAILEADKESMQIFNGHGSALAQVYNHLIMPLANRRDKETQIKWGLFDFERRFGRPAKGIWLAETAVDLETLDLLVENGIEFTVLAPSQAKRFRKKGEGIWNEGVDSNLHYECKLPSGKSITLFFYNGERSQGVAFKGLLRDGKAFAEDLISGFRDNLPHQLVHIATDGESYGHHHKNGDMALAYCLRYIETHDLARITNYTEYLSLFKPEHEIEIHENSSWSCAHGVERWRSDCGCHTGGEPGWNQKWRRPLREALDNLRTKLIEVFENETNGLLKDPWQARNEYVKVIFTRSKANIESYLDEVTTGEFGDRTKIKIVRLLEMQRHAQLMYTSCGWFFNELSGIETVQILQYACRAIQLAESESDYKLEDQFLADMDKAESNIEEMGTGKDIYERFIAPYKVSLTQVGMHYAVASLFANDPKTLTVLNYNCTSVKFERIIAGLQRLVIGTTEVSSKVTLSEKEFSFVVLYLGQHHIIGGTTQTLDNGAFDAMASKLKEAFNESNIAKVTDLIKDNFGTNHFSFFQMFKDEQLKMVNHFLEQSEDQAYEAYRGIYDINYNLLNVMQLQNLKIPAILKKNIELVVNTELKDVITAEEFSLEQFNHLVEEVLKWNTQLDFDTLNKEMQLRLEEMVDAYKANTSDIRLLENIQAILVQMKKIQLEPNLINIQNDIFHFYKDLFQSDTKLDNHSIIIDLLDCIAHQINLDFSQVKKGVAA